jgi:hypothetical protein
MLKKMLLVLIMIFIFSTEANATLVNVGTATYGGNSYNLLYDETYHLVWFDYSYGLDQWNDPPDPGGTISGASAWAQNLGSSLIVNLSPNYTSNIDWSTGWRLPSAGANPQEGYSQHNSEIGSIFEQKDLFQNMTIYYYWSSTKDTSTYDQLWFYSYINPDHCDWQGSGWQGNLNMAFAVHSGDVSPVPEPATMFLLGTGLICLVGVGKKKLFKS